MRTPPADRLRRRPRAPSPLRGVAVACALVGALVAPTGPAAASTWEPSTCGDQTPSRGNLESPWNGEIRVPTDARPWLIATCARPEDPLDCALEREDSPDGQETPEPIGVTIPALGGLCGDPYGRERPIRVVPERRLDPGAAYVLRCTSTPLDARWLVSPQEDAFPVNDLLLETRGDERPAMPPPIAIDEVAASLRRVDDTCCGGEPRRLELTRPESAEADDFAAEGGVYEVELERRTWVVPAADTVRLAPTDGDITIRMVAANGVRSPARTIAAEAIPEELIYTDFGCAHPRGPAPLLLWLLAPLALLRADTWRRRRAARRSR